ncbi:hypothetical protein RDABS01_012293, partial [Bienertia sinuspersici]
MIASHQLVPDTSMGDLYYWRGSTKGGFSIKYALQLIRTDVDGISEAKWDLAWKVPIQQRVKVFLWLILHNRILCNANRVRRNLSQDPRCPRCGCEEETTIHLLCDCSALYSSFFTGDITSWICINLQANGLTHCDKWPTCFAITLWWIWKWRNCCIFNRTHDIPLHTGTFIRSQVEDTWNAINNALNVQQNMIRIPQMINVRWIAPFDECFVLNTDGASKGTLGTAGGGGVIRDNRGIFYKGFSAHFGVCSAYRAELKAVAIGLDLAQEMDIQRLEIQMDNKACIEVLNNPDFQG